MRALWSLPVTWQDGGHTIRSAVSKNPMLHANFMAVRFIAGICILSGFCSRDLDLDPMTFIYKVDPYTLEI